MTSDFRLPPAASTPGSASSARPADAAALALQLLRPIDAAVLAPGQSAPAEVVRSTAQAGQFELLLRIARGNGLPPADVAVTSRQPVAEGTQLVVQAVNQTRLLAVLAAGATVASAEASLLTRLDPSRFPPDAQLQARILTQQPLLQQGVTQYAVVARIIEGPSTGALLSLQSVRPLEPGSVLTAQVTERGELRVPAVVEQQRQLAVTLGLRDSFQRQASPEALMALLDRLASPGPGQAPQSLQPIIRQVLMHVASVAQLSSEAGVQQAVKQSGLFLENNLAMLTEALKARPAGSSPGSMGDATQTGSAALPLNKILPLLATLATPPGVEPLPGADMKATLITLLMVLQQQLPPDSLKALGLPTGPWQQQATAKPGLFPLPSRALQALGEASDLGSLLRLTAALLSRIQHQQFQSLGQSQTFADGSSQTVWQMDLPLRDGQQFSHVQARIQRDDPAPTRKQPEPTPKWEVRLAFNLGPLGALQSIARLYKGRVSSEFWTDRSDTLSLLDREVGELRDRLLAKGLEVGEISCHQGTPPEPRQAVQRRWVDEVT
ncbi:hook-length control protein FliK [Halopseudomonas xinjiangensis]|uniref:Hook-length control protein FliK n=1 Tax=Halopseudomonas xinjiangensis TaxID=487184 RepID=A0A1H1NCT7_9GAMM|nr:flagellar hook-length control protein FliK [Halopseudomonas xinjiangensis]SDR96555.1 hook-length control protein FliK [Halopseudomonas xinjiangensis]